MRLPSATSLIMILAVILTAGCSRMHNSDPRSGLRHINVDSLYATASASLPDSLTADGIYLSAALLRPQQSMEALRARVKEGRIIGEEFPLKAVNAMWGAAAWEVYCATGSREWLREAYNVLTASMREERRLTRSPIRGLTFGIPEYSADAPGYYPEGMTDMERFQTISTAVNAERANASAVAALMAEELKMYAEEEYRREASNIRSAVNDRLWLPEQQRYGAYLYGIYFPIQNTASDAIANSLCVLFGVATPEMSEALVSRMPISEEGIPIIYPSTSNARNTNAQTLFALAAAKVRNPIAFAAGASALCGLPTDERNSPGLAAIVTRGFFGMKLTPKGIEFSPMVPADYPETKEISGLKYRDATLDIRLHGTGDRIASFAIDSVTSNPAFIPADLSGHHRIDLTLTGNELTDNSINLCEAMAAPAPVKTDWITPLTARLKEFDKDYRYMAFVNGAPDEEIEAETYTFKPRGKQPAFINICATDPEGYTGLSARTHIFAPAGTEVTVNASSVTPRRPPLHLIKDRATATNYIELAARHNTRITCYANIEQEGDYFLTVGYSNGSQRCALRTLGINDRDADLIICPAIKTDDWITVHNSNTVTVTLHKGVNKISLTYIRGTMLLNRISILRKP